MISLIFTYPNHDLIYVRFLLSMSITCSTIYLIQLLDRNIPADFLIKHPEIPETVATFAPALVLGMEVAIPLLLIWKLRSGLVLTALFHWLIAITPPPNDIASFGVQTLPRMLLFVPNEDSVTQAVRAIGESGFPAFIIASFAAFTVGMQPTTWLGRLDLAVPLCGAFVAILCLATASPSFRYSTLPKTTPGLIGWTLRILAVFYTLINVPLGIMDVGNASPFSSFRKHGGKI